MSEPAPDYVDAVTEAWRRERPDLDVAALGVTNRLLRAGHLLQTRLDQVAARHGLSHKGDLDVLTALRRSGSPHEMSPSQLAEHLLLTTGGMTTRLDRLERAGLLGRRPHATDRRSVVVTLTRRGRRVADEAFTEVLREQSDLVALLTPAAADGLVEGLRRLLAELGDVAAPRDAGTPRPGSD